MILHPHIVYAWPNLRLHQLIFLFHYTPMYLEYSIPRYYLPVWTCWVSDKLESSGKGKSTTSSELYNYYMIWSKKGLT